LFLAVTGCPIAASLGMPMSPVALFAAVFASGVCVIGSQFALYAVSGMIYPTRLRSTGVGSAIGVGKLGSVAGTVLGGVLLSLQLSIGALFSFVATASCSVARAARRAEPGFGVRWNEVPRRHSCTQTEALRMHSLNDDCELES